MSCSASFSRAVFVSSAVCLALLGCAGSLDHPERFANLGQGPDAGPVNPPSDGGCDPVVDIFPLSCSSSSCHSAQSQQGNLDLESPGLPNRLVGKTAHGGPRPPVHPPEPPPNLLPLHGTSQSPLPVPMP